MNCVYIRIMYYIPFSSYHLTVAYKKSNGRFETVFIKCVNTQSKLSTFRRGTYPNHISKSDNSSWWHQVISKHDNCIGVINGIDRLSSHTRKKTSPQNGSACVPYFALGADSIKRCHLTSIGNPIVEIRRSYDRL